MAVSGRKISDFHGSISRGSAEDFDQCCEPCLALGQHKEAHGLCVECQEYFCKNCYIYHQQIKATKHHQLLDKENMENNSVDLAVCTEECHIHKNEIVKFFCTNHEALGCTGCITLNHTACKIDYIPDKCAGTEDSDEYKETLRDLDRKINDIDAVIKKATLQDKEIDSSYDHVVTEIVKFRKEINDRLDQLQKKIQTDADKKRLNDKQTVKNVLDTCTAVSSDIKKFKSSLQDSKTSQQNGQLYIMIKQAKNKIKLDKLKTAQESLDQTSIKYTFQRNKELENLTKQDIFGNLNLPTTKVSLETKKEFDTLTHSGDINVRTNSDVTECSITGCAVLSNNKLVLVDKNNKKLKVLDMSSKAVTKEKTLDSVPWGIATVPPDHIAATIPKKKEIWLMETRKLKIICRIPVKGKCKGITYHQGHFYVVCWDPYRLFIVDTKGNVNKIFFMQNKIFANPNYILINGDANLIYVSNYDSHSVVSVTLQGEISKVYKHKDLSQPVGMTMLEDGSLLVCCLTNRTLHHISGDLMQGHTMIHDGIELPQSICYNHQKQEFYIGGWCDKLKIMK